MQSIVLDLQRQISATAPLGQLRATQPRFQCQECGRQLWKSAKWRCRISVRLTRRHGSDSFATTGAYHGPNDVKQVNAGFHAFRNVVTHIPRHRARPWQQEAFRPPRTLLYNSHGYQPLRLTRLILLVSMHHLHIALSQKCLHRRTLCPADTPMVSRFVPRERCLMRLLVQPP